MRSNFHKKSLTIALLVSSVTTSALADTAYLTGLGNTLDGLTGTTTDPGMLLLIQNLQGLAADPSKYDKAISALAPMSDGSLMVVSQNNVNQGLHMVQDRMEKVRMGYVMPNGTYSAGDWDTGTGGWIQLFGNDITQRKRNGIEGYDAWNTGFAVGFDKELMKHLTVGSGFSYVYSDVESKGLKTNHMHIQSYQGFAYSTWNGYEPYYLEGALSLAFHDYNTHRTINVAGATPIHVRAEGDFNAWQLGFWTEGGYDWLYQNWLITPHLNFKYSNLRVQSLQEKGAGSYNLFVDYDTMNEAVLGAGLRVGFVTELSGGMEIMPKLYAQVFHDFINDRQQSLSNFVGGGASFVTPGIKPSATSLRVGAGIDIALEDDWYITVNYDFNLKNDFHAHGGFLKFRYEWA